MITRNRDRPRCRWLCFYLLIQAICVSVTFFVRNTNDIRRADFSVNENGNIVLPYGKDVGIAISEDSVKVRDCYLYGRKERLAICSYIYQGLSERGFHERSIQSLSAELALHAICYRLGIIREQAVDADLDIHGDERWYVRAGYSLLEVFGV